MSRLAVLLAALVSTSAACAEPIGVNAQRILSFSRTSPAETHFGPLRFLGGLVLTSDNAQFGGFSGLRMGADGASFHAVSDRAHWLTGRIAYEGDRPSGIEAAELFPIRGPDGQPIAGTRGGDTEALEISDSIAFISTEGRHQVLRFALGRGAAKARGAKLPGAQAMADLRRNAGIEAIALVPDGPEKGTLVVIAEEPPEAGADHPAWLVSGLTTKPVRALGFKNRDGYAVTDMAFLPGGDLLVLERRYRPLFSLNMRLRRVPLASIAEGAVLDGEVLLEASLGGHDIDNMEALSVHRAADGRTVLTLMSDDNFNRAQKTILLQFALVE